MAELRRRRIDWSKGIEVISSQTTKLVYDVRPGDL
jgi:hypothetical protein